MAMMMTSPSTKPAVKVVLSRIALMVDTLNDRKSMGPGLGATVSITEAVPSPGDKGKHNEGIAFINFATSHTPSLGSNVHDMTA